jgi:hypothetical protein
LKQKEIEGPSRLDDDLKLQEIQRQKALEEEKIEKEREQERKRIAAAKAAEIAAISQAEAKNAKAAKMKRMQQFINANYKQHEQTAPGAAAEGSTTPPLLPPPLPALNKEGLTSPSMPPPSPLAVAAASMSRRAEPASTTSPAHAPPAAPAVPAVGLIKKRNLTALQQPSGETTTSSSSEVMEPNQVSRGLWDSIKDPRKQAYILPGFDLHPSTDGGQSTHGHNNVIRLKLSVPFTSKSWSLNISPEHDFHSTNILFHYNPRIGSSKYEVVFNDRQGTWGDYTRKVMDFRTERIVRDAELKIVIAEEGFYVFVCPSAASSSSSSSSVANKLMPHQNQNQSQQALGRLDSFFPHRRPIHSFQGQTLKLWFTYRDDNGNPHNVIVRKVYWESMVVSQFHAMQSSSMKSLVSSRLADPLPRSVMNPMPPRTALLSGLPILEDLKNLQGIESNLFMVFEHVESISLIPGTEFAFVRVSHTSLCLSF